MSHEVLKSELDNFKGPAFQASIESSQLIQFRPITPVNDANHLEFDIPPFPEDYLDLQNVFLWYKAKVVKQDDAAFDATQTDRYSLINYGLNTVWEQVDVRLGNSTVSQSSTIYPYRAFIDLITTYNSLAQGAHLRSAGLFAFETNPDNVDTDINKIIDKSIEFSYYGRLHADIFNSDRLLINGVPITISLRKGNDAFNFLAAAAAAPVFQPIPKLKLLDASIFVRKVKLAPSLLAAHAKALQHSPAKYPIKRTDLKFINLPTGQSNFVLDNVWMGQMPHKLIIGIVEHDAFTGDLDLNPLAFKNHNLNFLTVRINGEEYPSKPYQPDYANNIYAREFFELFNNLSYTQSPIPPSITYEGFKDYMCLYAFNFNADFENPKENEYINLTKDGFLNIELHFKGNTPKALKVMCFGYFDNTIEIDSNRNVTTDF